MLSKSISLSLPPAAAFCFKEKTRGTIVLFSILLGKSTEEEEKDREAYATRSEVYPWP